MISQAVAVDLLRSTLVLKYFWQFFKTFSGHRKSSQKIVSVRLSEFQWKFKYWKVEWRVRKSERETPLLFLNKIFRVEKSLQIFEKNSSSSSLSPHPERERDFGGHQRIGARKIFLKKLPQVSERGERERERRQNRGKRRKEKIQFNFCWPQSQRQQ